VPHNETDEDVVDGIAIERQLKDVLLPELRAAKFSYFGVSSGLAERVRGNAHWNEMSVRAAPCECDPLSADPASRFEHIASRENPWRRA